MGELEIVQVRRVSAFADRYDVINSRRQWMRIAIRKIYRLSAYPADCLRLEYLLPGGFEGGAVTCTPV